MSSENKDKSEEATPKRLEDAKKKGQVPKSKEVVSAALEDVGYATIYCGQSAPNNSSTPSGARASGGRAARSWEPSF